MISMLKSQQLQVMQALGSSLTRLVLSPWFGISVECQIIHVAYIVYHD